MLNVELPDRRRGKSQRKLMDVMKEEMQRVGVAEEEEEEEKTHSRSLAKHFLLIKRKIIFQEIF